MLRSIEHLLPLLTGCLLLTIALAYLCALRIPRLGRRMYGSLWPAGFANARQRRAAYINAAALIAAYSCWAGSALIQPLTRNLCGGTDWGVFNLC